ncbi:MAG: hypothetical protein K0R03_2589 [Moraxellaceae bacterium]|nr:hypothetical protein [Moraxellaceae bacterium]
MILKSWTRQKGSRVDALEITDEKVFVTSYEGEENSAVGCTREEFVEGKLNRIVVDVFGGVVLQEALQFLQRRH